MKKYFIVLLFILNTFRIFAQSQDFYNDSIQQIQAKDALKKVIDESKYIVEAMAIEGGDYYYILEDDQTYYRALVKVTKIIRGTNISVGDTIIAIWKQKYKGKGPYEIYVNWGEPRLWYAKNSTSCLFLTDSKYPIEPVADEWSRFKHTTYIPSSIGYFAALYVDENGHRRVSFESGIRFSRMTDWYNFLKQFPNVNAPMRY